MVCKAVYLPSHFCLHVLKDLTYKYSLRVGDTPPRTLYQGTDYQYYFSLPSGDPSDDYKGHSSLPLSFSLYVRLSLSAISHMLTHR